LRRSKTLLTALSAAAYLSLSTFAQSQAPLASILKATTQQDGILAGAQLSITPPQAANIVGTSGSISGSVLDATGAALVGAKVTATRADTGQKTTVTTNGSGLYVFASLPPGQYSVRVAVPGFQTFVETNVTLTMSQSTRVDAKLKVGSATATVQVQASAPASYAALDSSSATRTSTPLIACTLIVEQDAHTLGDALANVSGVVPTKPEEALFTPIIIRGFPAEIYVNGLLTYGGTGAAADPTSLVGIERVEVVKGPTSTLYGGGVGTPLGGLINIVSERPESKASGVVAFRGGSYTKLDPYGDINVPLGSSAAMRVAGEYQNTQSYIDQVHGDRWSMQGSLLFKLSDADQLLVQEEFQHRSQLEYSGIPAQQALAGQIDRNAFPGAPVGQPPSTIDNRLETIELGHRFTENVRLTVSARYYVDTSTEYGSFLYPALAAPDPATPTVYPIFPIYLPTSYKEGTLDANLAANVKALGGHHQLLGGLNYDHVNFQGDLGFLGVPVGNLDLANPVYDLAFGPVPAINVTQTDRYVTAAGYVQDQATYGRLHLLGSLRYTQLEFREREELIDQTYKHVSPHVGATVDIAHGIALYGGYSTAFRASFAYMGIAPPKPESSRNVEAGFKFALQKAGLSGTVAAFNQTHDNVPTADLNNPGFEIQTGQQRAKGVEADAVWEPVHALSILANYAYTEAAVTQSDPGNGIPVGNVLARVPRNSGRVAFHYRVANGFAKGLSFGSGVTGFSSRQVTLPNTVSTPGYAAIDAQVSYDFARHYTLMGSAANLLNRRTFDPYEYFSPVVIPNQPISGYATLKVHF
jgi:iron complex outermembrane receptor protein